MEFKSVSDVFNYISSLPQFNLRATKDSCDIWMSNKIGMKGTFVNEINVKTRDLIENEYSFIYNEDKIAILQSYETFIFSAEPRAFLDYFFNLYPGNLPIEYRLIECGSYVENAIYELCTLRQQLGRLELEYNALQEENYQFRREKKSLESETTNLAEESSHKTRQIVNLLIPKIESGSVISKQQLKKIHSFVNEYSKTQNIQINTGFKDNIVQLTYEIQKWGTADLAGIPVGYEKAITYFNHQGEETSATSLESDINISIGWDELLELNKCVTRLPPIVKRHHNKK